jgi:hypothetical protein
VAPFFADLVGTLADPFVIDPDSPRLVFAASNVVMVLLTAMQGRGKAAVEAQFLATGRLKSLKSAVAKVFRFFMAVLATHAAATASGAGAEVDLAATLPSTKILVPLTSCHPHEGLAGAGGGAAAAAGAALTPRTTAELASMALRALVKLDSDPPPTAAAASPAAVEAAGLRALFVQHGGATVDALLAAAAAEDEGGLLAAEAPDLALLHALVEAPWGLALRAPDATQPRLLDRLAHDAAAALGRGPAEAAAGAVGLGKLLVALLTPLAFAAYPPTATQVACYGSGLFRPTDAVAPAVAAALPAGAWPGVAFLLRGGASDAEALAAAGAAVAARLPALLEALVLHPGWARSPALQVRRALFTTCLGH